MDWNETFDRIGWKRIEQIMEEKDLKSRNNK